MTKLRKLYSPFCHPPQVRLGERRRDSESELVKLEDKVLRMEAEQEAVLTSMGEELDSACRSLARNGEDKLQVYYLVILHFIHILSYCTLYFCFLSCLLCVFKGSSCSCFDLNEAKSLQNEHNADIPTAYIMSNISYLTPFEHHTAVIQC